MVQRLGRLALFALVVVVAGWLAAMAFGGRRNAAQPASAPDRAPVVVLWVRGDPGDATLSLSVGGGMSQKPISLSYNETLAATSGAIVSFNAQRTSGGSGEIICELKVNGKVINTATSKGQYAVVACSGTIGQ